MIHTYIKHQIFQKNFERTDWNDTDDWTAGTNVRTRFQCSDHVCSRVMKCTLSRKANLKWRSGFNFIAKFSLQYFAFEQLSQYPSGIRVYRVYRLYIYSGISHLRKNKCILVDEGSLERQSVCYIYDMIIFPVGFSFILSPFHTTMHLNKLKCDIVYSNV